MIVHRLVSAANTVNNTLVSSTAARVHYICGVNANAAARYLKLYNKNTAPAAGTDTPIATLYLAPSSVAGGVFVYRFGGDSPVIGRSGLGFALTTGSADNDTGALTAADVLALNIIYSN
jgi:hypothetical protein